MRRFFGLAALLVSIMLAASCGPSETAEQRHHEANTAAGKLGQAAHWVTIQMERAGRAIGQQLGHAAHDAHEGWREADRRNRERKR